MIIGFQHRKRRYVWDLFTSNPLHCFIVYNIKGKLFKLEYSFNRVVLCGLSEYDIKGTEFYDIGYGKAHYRLILTCADFCASILGIKGIIITPNTLKRKIKNGKYVRVSS